jgi:hypothetical protein
VQIGIDGPKNPRARSWIDSTSGSDGAPTL